MRINRIFNVVNEGTMEKNQFKKYYGWLSSRHEKGMIRIDHPEYQNWNPSNARVKCFRDVTPLVEKYLTPMDRSTGHRLQRQDHQDVPVQHGHERTR